MSKYIFEVTDRNDMTRRINGDEIKHTAGYLEIFSKGEVVFASGTWACFERLAAEPEKEAI